MKIRVGILRGGTGSEYERSLASGAHILKHFPVEYTPVDIFVDREGKWHVGGYEIEPSHISKRADVLYNAIHGEYGEDGGLAHTLENVGIPFVGSRKIASVLAWDRGHTRDVYARHGLKVPLHTQFDAGIHGERELLNIFQNMPQPSVVRIATRDGRHTGAYADSYSALRRAVAEAGDISRDVIIETHIKGKPVSCVVMEGFRNETMYAFPVIEIKEEGATYPAKISREEAALVQRAARIAHEAFGARHYSQTHAIVSPKGIYVIETVTVPDHAPDSVLGKSLESVGVTQEQMMEHLVTQALK